MQLGLIDNNDDAGVQVHYGTRHLDDILVQRRQIDPPPAPAAVVESTRGASGATMVSWLCPSPLK